MKSLKTFNKKFIKEWVKTYNFLNWLKNHDRDLWEKSKYCLEPQKAEIFFYDNGDIYIGEMISGLKSGKGISYENNERFVYNGEWLNGEKSGNGVFSSIDNSYLYDGQFKENMKSGYGKLIANKVKYSGNFKL